MNKIPLLMLFICSIIFGQYDDIHYDWSGQYGVISENGEVIWNQDWQVGVLLFDGTFTNYPTRFGKSYRNTFVLKELTDSYNEIHIIPDTSNISSKADYYRGDFSYDQLEVDFNFEEQNRIIVVDGFKRTYSGPYGQYLNSNGSTNPLQQSYRIDYSSKNNNGILNLSAGYFYTDSRLNLNDPADFKHKEKITSIGLGYLKEFENWNYNSHAAMFQQYYRMSYDSTVAYLNRIHLNQFVERRLNTSSLFELGVELDNQALTISDEGNINRTWSTVYGGWKNYFTELRLGTTFIDRKSIIYLKILNQFDIGKIGTLNSNIHYSAKPKHLFYYDKGNDQFDKWLIANIKGDFNLYKIPLNIDFYCVNTNSDIAYKYLDSEQSIDLSENLITATFSTELPVIREWKIDFFYRHIFEHNLYSDGIGDRINIGLDINEKLFKKRMYTNLKLSADGYLNHKSNLGYEGFHYGPYVTDNSDLTLPDYWVFHLDFSVTVSKLTFGWKVNNILKTAESLTNQLFPNINENYLLITNSNEFPPMNRFVTFNIIWEFDN